MRDAVDQINTQNGETAVGPAEKSGLRKAEKHSSNPFLHGANAVVVKGKKRFYNVINKSDSIVNFDTGEVTGGVEHKVVRQIDAEEFVKVFAKGVSGIYDLSSAGRKVFTFLLGVVQDNPNTDRIYLNFMDAIEEPWKISKPVFFRGMGELVAKGFIAPSVAANMFFLNPAMIWNGDRFKFIQEYIRSPTAIDDGQRDEIKRIEQKKKKGPDPKQLQLEQDF